MFSYGSVFELLICYFRNGVFNLLLGELYPRENEVIPEVRKRRGGWPGFEVFVWRRLTSCWILSAMSPEIQERSHKRRSRINNLYLLTRPISPMAQSIVSGILGGVCWVVTMLQVTNKTVLERTDQNRKLLAMVKTRKLNYFGHISRHASLESDVMLGTVSYTHLTLPTILRV